jgi:hypothetical protein
MHLHGDRTCGVWRFHSHSFVQEIRFLELFCRIHAIRRRTIASSFQRQILASNNFYPRVSISHDLGE